MTISTTSLFDDHGQMVIDVEDALGAATSGICDTFAGTSPSKRVHRVVLTSGDTDESSGNNGVNRIPHSTSNFPASRQSSTTSSTSVPLDLDHHPHSHSSSISPRTSILGHTVDANYSSNKGASRIPPLGASGVGPTQRRRSSLSPATCRRALNYPLPLSESEHLRAIAIMQEKQESWSRAAAQSSSNSSASVASSPGSSAHSPLNRLTPIQSGPSGSSGSGVKLERKSSTNVGSAGASGGVGGVKGKTRKKVAKACLTCQKSHLTCDESEKKNLPCMKCR